MSVIARKSLVPAIKHVICSCWNASNVLLTWYPDMVNPKTLISSVQGPRTISCFGKYLLHQSDDQLLMPALHVRNQPAWFTHAGTLPHQHLQNPKSRDLNIQQPQGRLSWVWQRPWAIIQQDLPPSRPVIACTIPVLNKWNWIRISTSKVNTVGVWQGLALVAQLSLLLDRV